MEKKTYICDICGLAADDKSTIYGPVIIHCGTDSVQYDDVCHVCIRMIKDEINKLKVENGKQDN